ncbi:CLUMA_CG008286, isoform A [Clunio marinus]|uniref:CLUMA_CG008286, isoform A n=1 Tax=Clunio marinus TaxID=568069 RepID=A0A1J1I3A8_9DIPT|nr:CLUMA_CG008286, isoform A [Clunio marinus]
MCTKGVKIINFVLVICKHIPTRDYKSCSRHNSMNYQEPSLNNHLKIPEALGECFLSFYSETKIMNLQMEVSAQGLFLEGADENFMLR